MDSAAIAAWFEDYLAAFRAYAVGERRDPAGILAFCEVPMMLSSDAGFVSLTDAAAIARAMGVMAETAREAGYDHSVVLNSEVTEVNATTALLRTDLSRHRADGGELERLQVLYVVAVHDGGPRMAALLRYA